MVGDNITLWPVGSAVGILLVLMSWIPLMGARDLIQFDGHE